MPIIHLASQPSIVSRIPALPENRSDGTAKAGSAHSHLQPHSSRIRASSAKQVPSLSPVDLTLDQQELDQRQHQAQLLPCQAHESDPLDHRPDSPTSLEDSQSDSSVNSFSTDHTTLSERPLPRFSNGHIVDALVTAASRDRDPTLVMPEQYSMSIHTNAPNGHSPMSPSQVATPPLSPVKFPSNNVEKQDEDEEEEAVDGQSHYNTERVSAGESNTKDGSSIVTLSARSVHRSGSLNDKSNVLAPAVTLSQQDAGSWTNSEHSTASKTSPSMTRATTVPQPIEPAPLPKLSAWSTLLPGVAPIPIPKSTSPKSAARSPVARKSDELRLHERFPIVLPSECEAKLSMDMVDLFESLLPTEESHLRRTALVKKVENILLTEWPGQDFRAHPFGSTVNDLGTSSSDVDICIMTTWTGLKNVQMLANAFRKHGMQKVFCVPRAKVPIVKLWDPELHLSCDMNINSPLGLLNTTMIKTYVAIDPRVRPFAMIIKHWARRRVLNDAANGGTISTYTWICIVINFLQMRSPPILPKLHKIPHTLLEDNQVINGNNTSFCQDLAQLEGFGLPNKETLGGLLYAFFRRFAIEFDYDHHVISVREGCYLTKESKGWHLPGKQYKLFCVEEPFDTTRNLGNSSDMTSSKGLKEEFKRALEILHTKVSLNECCAQFVFPASYYYSNNNSRKGSNGSTTYHNYAPGRRYTNGYRSMNNYYDDDYDDDEDEDDSTNEVSVMETLNIGTRPSSSRDPTGSKHHGSSRGHGGENHSSTKSSSNNVKEGSNHHSGAAKGSDQSGQSRLRNRSKHSKGGEKEAAGDSLKSGLWRNGRHERSGAGSSLSSSSSATASALVSAPSGQRNKKSSGGDRQKNGRSGNGTSGSGGRGPRAQVEFSLADIATAAPKLLATNNKSDQESSSHFHSETVAGSKTGSEEGGHGGNSSNSGHKHGRRGGKRNVVWSTNSNRGETTRRQGGAKASQQRPAEQEKTKVILVAGEESGSGAETGTTTPTESHA